MHKLHKACRSDVVWLVINQIQDFLLAIYYSILLYNILMDGLPEEILHLGLCEMICLKIMSCSCLHGHLGKFDLVNSFLFWPFKYWGKAVGSCQDFHLTFIGPTRGEELERVAEEKGGVRTQNRSGGVMIGRGGLVWHPTSQHTYSGWWCFPRVGLEVGHKIFQSLSVCFIIGTFCTVHTQLRWLRDWHVIKK